MAALSKPASLFRKVSFTQQLSPMNLRDGSSVHAHAPFTYIACLVKRSSRGYSHSEAASRALTPDTNLSRNAKKRLIPGVISCRCNAHTRTPRYFAYVRFSLAYAYAQRAGRSVQLSPDRGFGGPAAPSESGAVCCSFFHLLVLELPAAAIPIAFALSQHSSDKY